MFLLPHILVRLLELLQPKHPLVQHRLQIINLHRPNHLVHLQPTSHNQAPDRAHMVQALQKRRLLLGLAAAEESDDADHAVHLDRLERLRHGFGPTHFDDVVHAEAVGGQRARFLTPGGLGFVVDDVVGAEGPQGFGLFVGGGRGDYGSAGGLGELQR